jgi:hypothetical protein
VRYSLHCEDCREARRHGRRTCYHHSEGNRQNVESHRDRHRLEQMRSRVAPTDATKTAGLVDETLDLVFTHLEAGGDPADPKVRSYLKEMVRLFRATLPHPKVARRLVFHLWRSY